MDEVCHNSLCHLKRRFIAESMLSAVTEPLHRATATVTATKSISFAYAATDELTTLFEDFRLMCNDAIRVAVREKPKNRFKLIELAYASLKGYGSTMMQS